MLGHLDATVEAKGEGGEVTLSFVFHGPVLDQAIAERGDMPLPPYIASRRKPDDQEQACLPQMSSPVFDSHVRMIPSGSAGRIFSTA